MIKKLSLFFSAIAIGIISIFSGISTKNAAEPQYFLKNTQIKNRIVETNTSEYTIYIDPQIDNYNGLGSLYNIFKLTNQSEVYYITNETDNFINANLNNSINDFWGEFPNDTFIQFNANSNSNYFQVYNIDFDEGYDYLYKNKNDQSIWKLSTVDEHIENVIAVKFTNVQLENTINNINSTLEPYIGNLTSLPIEEEPIPPLEQINTLVSDIVKWFTSIFDGLGNVFYDPTANKLTAWGTVMFIGVAIMLISMALKWVISLIRGV